MSDQAPEPEPEPEPCYGCGCCELWQGALQLLRDHTARHVAGELRLAPCHPECLLCAEIDWQGPPEPDDAARAEMRATLAAGHRPRLDRRTRRARHSQAPAALVATMITAFLVLTALFWVLAFALLVLVLRGRRG